MMSNNKIAYYLIFDTNVLFQAYEKKANFTAFSFNATYENVIDMINQLDIYDQVILAIPSIVWSEMEKQIIEKHDELLLSYKTTITRKLFPEYSVHENTEINYPEYIKAKIVAYKADLSNGLNKVIELPIASNSCFDSIVNRAFNKLEEFESIVAPMDAQIRNNYDEICRLQEMRDTLLPRLMSGELDVSKIDL